MFPPKFCYKPLLVIAIGNSGAGKDTLAAELIKLGCWNRLSFGDALRADMAASGDSSPGPDKERELDGYGMCYKDWMVRHAEAHRLTDPYRYPRLALESFESTGHVIATDCRRPAELLALLAQHEHYSEPGSGCNVFLVYVQRDSSEPTRKLDGLLLDSVLGDFEVSQYAHVIRNYGQSAAEAGEDMAARLRDIVTRKMPLSASTVSKAFL